MHKSLLKNQKNFNPQYTVTLNAVQGESDLFSQFGKNRASTTLHNLGFFNWGDRPSLNSKQGYPTFGKTDITVADLRKAIIKGH